MRSQLTHAAFPHIIESIVFYTDYKTKLRCRATCHALKRFADKALIAGAIRVTSNGHDCTVIPYSGDHYPFFEPDGDRPAQVQKVKDCKEKGLFVKSVNASCLNWILAECGSLKLVSRYHNSRTESNYQLPGFGPDSFLAVHLARNCGCHEQPTLLPPFSHKAPMVFVELDKEADAFGLTDCFSYDDSGDVLIAEGSVSRCHLLRHALNSEVTLLEIIIPFNLSASSAMRLPHFVFGHRAMPSINPKLLLRIDFSVTSMSEEATSETARENLKQSFAGYLGILPASVLIAFGRDEGFC